MFFRPLLVFYTRTLLNACRVDTLFEHGSYTGTSLMRNRHSIGPYRRTMLRLLWRSFGGGGFLMSEVPLYRKRVYFVRVRSVWLRVRLRLSLSIKGGTA